MALPEARAWSVFERIAAGGVGAVLVYCQFEILSGYYNSTLPVMLIIIPLFSTLLAVVPILSHKMLREGRYFGGSILAVACVGLAIFSLSGAIARTGEGRATKGTTAASAHAKHLEAKAALETADKDVADATTLMNEVCKIVSVNTETTVTKGKSKKSRTETSTETRKADPRCTTFTTELAARRAAQDRASERLEAAPDAAEADADLDAIAGVIPYLSSAQVKRFQPAVMPVTLELLMCGVFSYAFRPFPDKAPMVRQPLREAPLQPSDNISILETADGMTQEIVRGLVAKWIDEKGLPVGSSISQACKDFNVWVKIQPDISIVRFGKAIEALGVKKRKLSGKTLIAENQPKRRTAR